jgi:3-phosphoshikimate 1-carboxyvinyltransferase
MTIEPDDSAPLAIEPRGPIDVTLSVPGSKSITNRAVLIAALADGRSELEGVLESDDTVAMRTALGQLGVTISIDGERWEVEGRGGRLAASAANLDLGNAGTAMRFLTAACTLADGACVLDGNARMRERPIADLLDALGQLGGSLELLQPTGCPPLRTFGGGLGGGEAEIDASQSSQYVSALLLAAPYAAEDVTLRFRDGVVVSRPYIDVTLQVMSMFGAEAQWQADRGGLEVGAGAPYRACSFAVEPDASSAMYPLCAAAIRGGRARVVGIPSHSKQSDLGMLPILEAMGCHVVQEETFVEVIGPPEGLRSPGRVDFNDFPDAALAFAVVALFADGPTRIENVATLRIKETDRIAALESELSRLGARVTSGSDWLEIQPGPLHGAHIQTYDDHRMAMSFALAGLRVPGVAICDPGCVSKTWPGYFDSFSRWTD